MRINKQAATIYYTKAETTILTGHNDGKRDDLNRELLPQIKDVADELQRPVDVYYADGTMDGQYYPRYVADNE